jgi:hypothetical protein
LIALLRFHHALRDHAIFRAAVLHEPSTALFFRFLSLLLLAKAKLFERAQLRRRLCGCFDVVGVVIIRFVLGLVVVIGLVGFVARRRGFDILVVSLVRR